jgi:uncharacterized OB-fold protein
MTAFSVARDDDSAPFFDAAARHELVIRRCERCERFYPPHQHSCGDGGPLRWVPAAGSATLVAWAVDHSPPVLALASPDGESSVLGLVELDEGPWMYAPIVDAAGGQLHEGAKLTVRFVRPGDGEVVPVFSPM